MTKIVTAQLVAQALQVAIPRLACELPADVLEGITAAAAVEADPRGKQALNLLCANACLARVGHLPICQDTGTVRVTLEIGPDVAAAGDVFAGVDAVVAEMYTLMGYRASVVQTPLWGRKNTTDNTPAFCQIECCDEPGAARLHVMLKGGGSDNASRVTMLPPSAGIDGVVAEVVNCVAQKAPNACPPLVVGVGVGSTFDGVGALSAKALRRPVDQPAADPDVAALEERIMAEVQALGIGAGAQGGAATALCVHVETAPCHIAALPVAVDLGCSAMRRATIDLADPDGLQAITAPVQVAAPAASGAAEAPAAAPAPKHLTLPLRREDLAGLQVGDALLLTGTMYTLRDAGHARLVEELAAAGVLPYDLAGQTIFYAGPTPASPFAPQRPFGAVGPTTSSRMDAWAPTLYEAGIVATVGKGSRAAAVAQACAATGSIYLTAIGGAAALLGTCVTAETVVAYDDLGTEALRRIEVKDLPVSVAIDARGNVFVPGQTAAQEGRA